MRKIEIRSVVDGNTVTLTDDGVNIETGRPKGGRANIMNALRKLDANGDPVFYLVQKVPAAQVGNVLLSALDIDRVWSKDCDKKLKVNLAKRAARSEAAAENSSVSPEDQAKLEAFRAAKVAEDA